MTAASRPRAVRLRSGDVVTLRQVRPADAPALARAYANLGEQSRYRRFFTLMPELPASTLRAATEVDHDRHEALVAVPSGSSEIVGECRFVRLADHPDTADVAVTVVDAWQNRGLGSALLRRLGERAVEIGVAFFSAEILAENRAVFAMLSGLGEVHTESNGSVVTARIELADPPGHAQQDVRQLLAAAARGEIVSVPTPLRRLIEVSDALAHRVLLPVTGFLKALRPHTVHPTDSDDTGSGP